MSNPEKDMIVQASSKRFAYYGYGKTTMAEIASDCHMSVGNIYRFYKNKEDVAVAGARTCLRDKAETSELAAAEAGTAMQALRAYCLSRLRHLHNFVSETPHMHELVQLIVSKHKDVLQHFEDRARKTILEIVITGIDAHEFRSCDAVTVAADLYNATNKYNMPMCMDIPLDKLEAELESLLCLLYEGMKEVH